jgi:hypothetical protein
MEHLGVIESEIRRLGQMRVAEQIFTLRDVAQIQEKLMILQEELEQELVKLRLVNLEGSDTDTAYDNANHRKGSHRERDDI